MNTTEKNTLIKNTAKELCNLDRLMADGTAFQIDTYTFAIPVEVEGKSRYAKVVISATSDKDVTVTKGARAGSCNEAFDLEVAVRAYEEKLAAAEERKAAKKAKQTESAE